VFDKETSQYMPEPMYHYAAHELIEPPKKIDAPF